jgi:hypothetical protein
MRANRRPTILIDSREQRPYSFGVYPTKTLKLTHGDYSIRGLRRVVCVERKSLPDFFSSFTKTRARMETRLKAMGKLDYAAVVVEADAFEIFDGSDYSAALGPKMLGDVATMCAYHGVCLLLCGDRDVAEQTTLEFLLSALRKSQADDRVSGEDAALARRKKRG